MDWNVARNFVSGTMIQNEIAGQTLAAGAVPVVPFDPGAQLIAGVVTLDEEETFVVQVKGHIDVSTADAVGMPLQSLLLQWGCYKAQFNPVVGTFQCPPIGTALGIADVNWAFHQHKLWDFPNLQLTTIQRLSLPFAATLRIGQGVALMAAMQADWTAGPTVSYRSYLEYRILRNVD
jgi:hypothetical protein